MLQHFAHRPLWLQCYNYKPQVKPKLLHSPMVISNLPSSGLFSWASDWKEDAWYTMLRAAINGYSPRICSAWASCLVFSKFLMHLHWCVHFIGQILSSRMQGHHIYSMKQCKVQEIMSYAPAPNRALSERVVQPKKWIPRNYGEVKWSKYARGNSIGTHLKNSCLSGWHVHDDIYIYTLPTGHENS